MLNKKKYQAILEAILVPFATDHYGSIESVILQQDNCGSHQSKAIKAYMDANKFNLMKWPAQSPDLNQIENAWSILKRMLRRRPRFPTTTAELFGILQHERMSIPNGYFTNLIRSMPTRVTLVKLKRQVYEVLKFGE